MPVPDWYAKQYWEDVEQESIEEADRDLDEYVSRGSNPRPRSDIDSSKRCGLCSGCSLQCPMCLGADTEY
jgi:hypothetical protein